MSMVDRKMFNEIQNRAVEQCVEYMLGLTDALLADSGKAYGDVELNREERIAATMMQADNGSLDMQGMIAPEITERQMEQFMRDMQNEPVERGL